MNRTEISQQLAEIKIEVITSKTKFKKIAETTELKESSVDLMQKFSSIIDQLTMLEKEIFGHRFLRN